MAQIISRIESSKVVNELDTYNFTVAQAGMHKVKLRISQIPPSGLSVVIQQQGSTKATIVAPAAAQLHSELEVVLNCAVSDVVAIIISSSVAGDQLGNSFKAILSITQGSF